MAPAPMLATAGTPPADPSGWGFEMKWDGMRAVADTTGGRCELYSRNGKPVTGSFPEIAAAVTERVGAVGAVLDGEIIAPGGEHGAPAFSRFQPRMHVRRAEERRVGKEGSSHVWRI